MKLLKRFLSATMCFIILFQVSAFSVSADNGARYELDFDVNARAYIVVSLDTGEVIFEKNSQDRLIPASLTKLMTAYVAMKYIDDLDGTMITAPNVIYDELYGLNSSTADIRPGEVLSARRLLYALLLPSANEAASILAYYIGNGNIDNFLMIMNSEAKKLGCTNTNFTNVHGLFTDNHYTSAYDMYLIAKACYETEGFMDIVTKTRYELPTNKKHATPYYILSTVKMQNASSPYYRDYVRGMKTGSLPEIGHNFVSLCENNEEKYICVVIGADNTGDKYAAFVSTAQIMDYFFENYSLRQANTSELPVTEVAVRYSKETDKVLLYADTPVKAILPNSADESTFLKKYNLPKYVDAPLSEGDTVGTVEYYLGNSLVGTSDLKVHENVDRSLLMLVVGKFQEAYSSLYFRTVLCVSAVLIALYLVMLVIVNKRNDKKQKIRRRR